MRRVRGNGAVWGGGVGWQLRISKQDWEWQGKDRGRGGGSDGSEERRKGSRKGRGRVGVIKTEEGVRRGYKERSLGWEGWRGASRERVGGERREGAWGEGGGVWGKQ